MIYKELKLTTCTFFLMKAILTHEHGFSHREHFEAVHKQLRTLLKALETRFLKVDMSCENMRFYVKIIIKIFLCLLLLQCKWDNNKKEGHNIAA